jgi:hypothetical protein
MHLNTDLICLKESEQDLGRHLSVVATWHHQDFEVREGCKLFAEWSKKRLTSLAPFLGNQDRQKCDPLPLSSALFENRRDGSYKLLCDLRDLMLLTQRTNTLWITTLQAAKTMKVETLLNLSIAANEAIDRQINWLCTQIKVAAPQALTVRGEWK